MADESGPLPLELLERGEPSFVDAIRQVHDADALAAFAEVWFRDQRPDSRRLLFEYLDRPLNAFRHEGLIKRLFKLAEAAGDDELMARFLVLFDRSVRRVRRNRNRSVGEIAATQSEAEALVERWKKLGYRSASFYGRSPRFWVHAVSADEVIRLPKKSVMPRGRMVEVVIGWPSRKVSIPDWSIQLGLGWQHPANTIGIESLPEIRKRLEKFRLFSLATRAYLRRRAWRYFRKLGKNQPERYVNAVTQALNLYRDEDVADGLALIDNWGLVHILFHHSASLDAKPSGWSIKPGRSLAELSPTPIHEKLWDEAPQQVVGLLSTARSSTVRRWALRRIEADPTTHRPALSLEGWLDLLGHADPEVVVLASRMLEGIDGLEVVGVDRWLSLAESTDPSALEVLCSLIDRHLKPDRVMLDQAVKLAGARALPVAKLGFSWLKSKPIDGSSDVSAVMNHVLVLVKLVNAECLPMRPEILRWLQATLAGAPGFAPEMILEFLDSRHADARLVGWNWFRSEPRASDDVETWRKLLESPYDDVRLALVAELESRTSKVLDPDDLRPLWASVLLNIHRGSRAKPAVVRQLVDRLQSSPDDARELLSLLGVALRSVRGPERRSGLVAVVRLIERQPDIEPFVRQAFPELQWSEEVPT
jgi:hypothetical protein